MNIPSVSENTSDICIKSAINKVQLGDIETYALIIHYFQKQIYLYCYYLLENREDAEDAAQEIFIKGLDNIKSFSYTVSFSAWLYKIAHNHCLDLLKKRSKIYQLLNKYKKYQEHEYRQESMNRHMENIQELLALLNMDERKILLLRALEDYSFSEIGFIMDRKPATLRKKYERIRKKLQKKMRGEELEKKSHRSGK